MNIRTKLKIVSRLFKYEPIFFTTLHEMGEGVEAVSAIASQKAEKSVDSIVKAMQQEKVRAIVLSAVYAYLKGDEKKKFINLLNEKDSD